MNTETREFINEIKFTPQWKYPEEDSRCGKYWNYNSTIFPDNYPIPNAL